MNCKQGDLALVMWGSAQGQAVTCLEALPAGFQRDDLPPGFRQRIAESAGPLWRIDRAIEWGDLVYLAIIPDAALKPIGRGSPDPIEERQEQHTVEGC